MRIKLIIPVLKIRVHISIPFPTNASCIIHYLSVVTMKIQKEAPLRQIESLTEQSRTEQLQLHVSCNAGQLLKLLMSLPKALKTFLFFKHVYIWLRISGKFNTMTTQPVTLAPSAQVGKAGDNQKFQARLSYIGRPHV